MKKTPLSTSFRFLQSRQPISTTQTDELRNPTPPQQKARFSQNRSGQSVCSGKKKGASPSGYGGERFRKSNDAIPAFNPYSWQSSIVARKWFVQRIWPVQGSGIWTEMAPGNNR